MLLFLPKCRWFGCLTLFIARSSVGDHSLWAFKWALRLTAIPWLNSKKIYFLFNHFLCTHFQSTVDRATFSGGPKPEEPQEEAEATASPTSLLFTKLWHELLMAAFCHGLPKWCTDNVGSQFRNLPMINHVHTLNKGMSHQWEIISILRTISMEQVH